MDKIETLYQMAFNATTYENKGGILFVLSELDYNQLDKLDNICRRLQMIIIEVKEERIRDGR